MKEDLNRNHFQVEAYCHIFIRVCCQKGVNCYKYIQNSITIFAGQSIFFLLSWIVLYQYVTVFTVFAEKPIIGYLSPLSFIHSFIQCIGIFTKRNCVCISIHTWQYIWFWFCSHEGANVKTVSLHSTVSFSWQYQWSFFFFKSRLCLSQ